jgi:hypothetical protein
MGRAADLGICFSIFLVFIRPVSSACALDVPCRAGGLFVPKPSSGVIALGKSVADLRAASAKVRWRVWAAGAIVTQLVTHPRLVRHARGSIGQLRLPAPQ